VSGAATVAGAPGDNGGSGAGYAGRSGFPAVTYCSSGTSSSGCAASMSSTGMPSASLATPFALNVSNVDGQRAGLIFYGASGTETTPWGGASTLCVKSPLQRTRTQLSGGSAGACDGALVLDWNLFVTQYPTALGQPFTAGEQLWAQAWYRDPASGKTTQLSDALAFVVQP
jgi:hypothetical protein